MTEQRWAVINKNSKVVNIIVWDGKARWTPPPGCKVVRDNNAHIGDTYERWTGRFKRAQKMVE